MAGLNVFVQDLESELTCQLCFDILTAPKSLSCMHSYCFKCIQQWIEECRSKGKKVTCPACRSIEDIDDASKLRSTFWIASLLQLLTTMRNSTNNQQQDQQELTNCVSCTKQAISVAFCPQCDGMICSECVNAHKTFKAFVDEHEATLLCNFKKENMSCYIKNRAFCQEKFHEKDKLQYYCRTCSKCICQRCLSTSTQCKPHDTVAIEVAAEEAKAVLKQNMDRLNEVKENYIRELALSKQNIRRIYHEIAAAKTNVHAEVEAQISILREHEDNMVKSLEEILVEQKTSNKEEQNDIETSIKEISEYQRIGQTLQEDEVSLFIVESIDNLPQKCESLLERQSVLFSKPSSRNASVQYVPNLVHDFGKIVNCVTDPGHCSVEGVSEFRCGFNNEFQIVTRNSEDELWYTFIDDIEVQIQDNSGQQVENEVEEIETGKYSVQYRPEKTAKHKITVNICGKPVKSSPQNVKPLDVKTIQFEYVYSFDSFGEVNPVNQMIARNRLDKPFSLALNDKGILAIADYNKDRVIICSIEGRNVTQFYGKAYEKDGQLNYPWGVAFNGEHLLVSDHPAGKGRLQEFSVIGTFHRTICTLKDVMLRGICVSDDTIAVCCKSQNEAIHSGIKLFEKETGQFLKSVSCMEEDEVPLYIAYGYGKYFVSYGMCNTFRIFDDGFSFEHNPKSFGKKGDRDGQFDSVGGIATYGPDAILVCDSQNHRVQVFTRKGKFIKSFGTLTTGEMKCPSDVVVSQSGEVLVLQCLSGAVTVWK